MLFEYNINLNYRFFAPYRKRKERKVKIDLANCLFVVLKLSGVSMCTCRKNVESSRIFS